MTNSTGIGADPESNGTSINEVDGPRRQHRQSRDQPNQPSNSRTPQGSAPLARYDEDVQPKRVNKIS